MSNDWVQKWEVTKKGGNSYITSMASDGSYGCSCPAWTLQRKQCKHIKMIQGFVPVPYNYEFEKIWEKENWISAGSYPTSSHQIVQVEEAHLESNRMKPKVKRSAKNKIPSIMDLIKENAQY